MTRADFPDGISIYHGGEQAEAWLKRYRGQSWQFQVALAFTETALVPGISAAGKTAGDRQFTAHADAEFLYYGIQAAPQPSSDPSPRSHPLPPLTAGLSPVLLSRALLEATGSPATLINAGLAHPLGVPHIDLAQRDLAQRDLAQRDLEQSAARCLSTGAAMSQQQVQQCFEQGLALGETAGSLPSNSLMAREAHTFIAAAGAATTGATTAGATTAGATTARGDQMLQSAPMDFPRKISKEIEPYIKPYIVLGECVVGGTTTALGLLMGLGVDALGRVNSSHGQCNHKQKAALVEQGLSAAGLSDPAIRHQADPLEIVAALGDPMQPFLAGYAIALSRHQGVLLAGGTQMLAVYALATAMAQSRQLPWQPGNIAVGTTRWVAADPTGDTPGLAQAIEQQFGQAAILLATDLSFAQSHHGGLRAYEAGFVKEGVGAGGCAIATALSLGWSGAEVAEAIEDFVTRYSQSLLGFY